MERWGDLWSDHTYRFVLETELPNGIWIATIWKGIDHFLRGEPLIFESMVFRSKTQSPLRSLDEDHYATEEEARQGHAVLVETWSAHPGFTQASTS